MSILEIFLLQIKNGNITVEQRTKNFSVFDFSQGMGMLQLCPKSANT